MVAFVCWVVAIAFVAAVVQSQSQSGALSGVVRVVALRTVIAAGESALNEACYVLRHPSGGITGVLDEIRQRGATTGTVHIPQATMDAYKQLVETGILKIDPIVYDIVWRPTEGTSAQPWSIELSVRVTYQSGIPGARSFSREIRRRYSGRLCQVRESMGPRKGEVVLAALYLSADPLVQVVQP